MTRANIRDKLKKSASGAEFITKGDIKRCMGWGSDRVTSTVKGLDFVRQGRTQQYDVDEVSARIYEQVEVRRYYVR
jgi:hypothetical protein